MILFQINTLFLIYKVELLWRKKKQLITDLNLF